MKQTTCCFIGHRQLSPRKIQKIVTRLNKEIDLLIQMGVTHFISSGAIGFAYKAASKVINKRNQGADIRLIFALPCRNHDERWTEKQRRLYRPLLEKADDILYISEEFTIECMMKRSRYMLDNSAYCICYISERTGGIGQILGYAQQQSVQVINIVK